MPTWRVLPAVQILLALLTESSAVKEKQVEKQGIESNDLSFLMRDAAVG